MDELLSQLGRDILPKQVVSKFIYWCVWQQARQALVLILEEAKLTDIAESIQSAQDLPSVTKLSEKAKSHIELLDNSQNPRGLSAAEGAVFEFINMAKSAEEATFDAEGVSFFASRVCGWAGWAVTGFSQMAEKAASEEAALQAQEAQLKIYWETHQTDSADNAVG
jgi:hypothetical protein